MKWCDDYLSKVLSQLRVKRIRNELAAELEDHLALQRQCYIDEGLDVREAERRAIQDMGDPLLVGGALDRAHRPRTAWTGVLTALALMAVGTALRFLYGTDASRTALPVLTASMGLILLLGCTDYTMWLRAAAPAAVLWAMFAVYRIYILHTSAWHLSSFAVYIMGPQVLAVAIPVLLAMLTSRLRGRGFGAFAVCLALPALVLATAVAYRHTGFDPYPVALMALLGFGVLALAVREGFFALDRRFAYSILALGALASAVLFSMLVFPDLVIRQAYRDEILLPLYRHARLFGRSRGFALLNPSDAGMFQSYEAFGLFFLAGVVALCGWLPFAALALGIAAAFAGLYRRFLHMENRMGRLIGLAGTATLAVQVLLHFLCCFVRPIQQLCLPLLSQGNAMLLADAVIVGLMLSALRGEALPEPRELSGGLQRIKLE